MKICDECETVAHCTRAWCIPKVSVNEAMKLALEALEQLRTPLRVNTSLDAYDVGRAITALREALVEQPAQQQKLVAWECDVLQIDGRWKKEIGYVEPPEDGVNYAIKNKRALTYCATPSQPAQQEPVATESVLIDGTSYTVPAPVACEILRLHLEIMAAPVQQVALDVTLEGDEARALYDLLGDDREDLSPVRLLVGDGHSGYGLYAELIASITPPAPQPAQQCRTDGRCQYAIDSGAEGMGHCPKGKCVMPAQQQKPDAIVTSLTADPDGVARSGLDRELPLMASVYLAPQPAQRKPLTDWVNVDERLPEKGGYYLVTVDTDDGPHVDVLLFNEKRKHWEHEGEPTFCHSYFFNPTHWANRPEAAHNIKENT